MRIGEREISNKFPPYIIAELSCNHAGVFKNAIALIDAAKEAGADAVKVQCYTPDDMTIDCAKKDFVLQDGPWKGRTLYELYAKAHTPREWFGELFAHARSIGIEIFSSVFSPAGVDFLEQFNPPAYKIASFEITDIPLIKYAASIGKPLIISTGMADVDEIVEAMTIAGGGPTYADGDFERYRLLACVSGYPTPIEEANLLQLTDFINLDWGISDHSTHHDVAVAATALGAQIIEKHLMLDLPIRQPHGHIQNDRLGADYEYYMPEDFDFSMRPEEFATMVCRVRAIWQAMQPSERKSEESSRQARRSLYVVKDMKAGDRFTKDNVRSIRPAYGMPPKELERVLQNHAAYTIEAGTALEEAMLVPF